MEYIFLVLIGFGGGYALVHFLTEKRRRELTEFQERLSRREVSLQAESTELSTQRNAFNAESAAFHLARTEFDRRVISYAELAHENGVLKRDLKTLHQQWRKSLLDQTQVAERQTSLAAQTQTLGVSYLKDQQKWISSSLNVNNFATCKKRLLDAIENLRGIGLTIGAEEEQRLIDGLTAEFERVVRASLEREEQARIRAQIREEQKREKEVKRAIEQADREKALVEAALARALAAAQGQHSAEIEQLQAKLAEAEAKSQRAVSQAQLTKSGYVYVISNIGSFGEGMFKIGMTRRLEPLERVEELGDASVPFPFDVHMMISTNDAPTLENALHRAFRNRRVNRVNLRKEFFRVGLNEVAEVVKTHHGEVEYKADPEALQYRNSLQMSEEDLERLDEVFEDEEEQEPVGASEVD